MIGRFDPDPVTKTFVLVLEIKRDQFAPAYRNVVMVVTEEEWDEIADPGVPPHEDEMALAVRNLRCERRQLAISAIHDRLEIALMALRR